MTLTWTAMIQSNCTCSIFSVVIQWLRASTQRQRKRRVTFPQFKHTLLSAIIQLRAHKGNGSSMVFAIRRFLYRHYLLISVIYSCKEFLPAQWAKIKGIEKEVAKEYKKLAGISEVNAKYPFFLQTKMKNYDKIYIPLCTNM